MKRKHSHYHMVKSAPRLGDDVPTPTASIATTINSSDTVKTVSSVAMTYHGYKRTGSVLWALAYGIAGRIFPLIAVPVAAAQGFGKTKNGGGS